MCYALARSAAIDLARYGIRVSTVAPGAVDTAIAELAVHNPKLVRAYLKTIPARPLRAAGDIVNAVLFASDEASYVTGHMLVVVGGGQTLEIPGDLESAAEDTGEEGG